jgi:hypothetical protein
MVGNFRACVAVVLGMFAITPALTGSASADALEMFIENTSANTTLYFESSSGMQEHPDSITPGTTSGEIKAGSNRQTGQITYMNNQVNDDATCTVTLHFKVDRDGCDGKDFTLTSTGPGCALARDGTCYGAGSCKCNFTFTDQ